MLSPKDRKVLGMFHDRHLNRKLYRWDDKAETMVFDEGCAADSRAWDWAIEMESIDDIYGDELVDLEGRGYVKFEDEGWWHYTAKTMSELGLK